MNLLSLNDVILKCGLKVNITIVNVVKEELELKPNQVCWAQRF